MYYIIANVFLECDHASRFLRCLIQACLFEMSVSNDQMKCCCKFMLY
jgi:hypothetical protein